jgi:DNA-binding transcriptional ArsR family regulator
MDSTPAAEYREMAANALRRVHAEFERRWRPPDDEASWSRALAPALTSARLEDALALIADPEGLKRRTIAMYEGVWKTVYRDARDADLPMLREAAQRGAGHGDRGFAEAYAYLTGQRVPDVLDRPPPSITRITFCPSAHLGGFVSYIAYEPDLVVFFSAPQLLARHRPSDVLKPTLTGGAAGVPDTAELLETARALADPTRLRMIDLLLEGERYAQEIVGQLGVAQSAASRHLAQLERAGLVTVEARRGSKYYAVNADKLEAVASSLVQRGSRARALHQ